jgi:origin recognition complex subunit 4
VVLVGRSAHRLSAAAPKLSPRALFDGAVSQRLDAKAAVLIGLSILELCLVIAMANHSSDHETAFNFELVYEGYRDFVLADGSRAGD